MALRDRKTKSMTGYRCTIGRITRALPDAVAAEMWDEIEDEYGMGPTELAEAILPWLAEDHDITLDFEVQVSPDMIFRHRTGKCRHCAAAPRPRV